MNEINEKNLMNLNLDDKSIIGYEELSMPRTFMDIEIETNLTRYKIQKSTIYRLIVKYKNKQNKYVNCLEERYLDRKPAKEKFFNIIDALNNEKTNDKIKNLKYELTKIEIMLSIDDILHEDILKNIIYLKNSLTNEMDNSTNNKIHNSLKGMLLTLESLCLRLDLSKEENEYLYTFTTAVNYSLDNQIFENNHLLLEDINLLDYLKLEWFDDLDDSKDIKKAIQEKPKLLTGSFVHYKESSNTLIITIPIINHLEFDKINFLNLYITNQFLNKKILSLNINNYKVYYTSQSFTKNLFKKEISNQLFYSIDLDNMFNNHTELKNLFIQKVIYYIHKIIQIDNETFIFINKNILIIQEILDKFYNLLMNLLLINDISSIKNCINETSKTFEKMYLVCEDIYVKTITIEKEYIDKLKSNCKEYTNDYLDDLKHLNELYDNQINC